MTCTLLIVAAIAGFYFRRPIGTWILKEQNRFWRTKTTQKDLDASINAIAIISILLLVTSVLSLLGIIGQKG